MHVRWSSLRFHISSQGTPENFSAESLRFSQGRNPHIPSTTRLREKSSDTDPSTYNKARSIFTLDPPHPTPFHITFLDYTSIMERMFLNQTALSLGYIAMKRIRALEEHRAKRAVSPLLLQLGHIKILAACVEQVGPDEIIEYQINQDFGVVEEALDAAYAVPERQVAADDVANPPHPKCSCRTVDMRKSLVAIPEDDEDVFCVPLEEKKGEVTSEDIEEGEYSMDDLYDEYNAVNDGWETESDCSDDESSQSENIAPSQEYRLSSSVETDSEDEEETPSPPMPSISRSPPLDITSRHPITNELSKREQYRKEIEANNSDLSRGFVDQFEDVLSHDFRCLSIRGRMYMDSLKQRPVSLYA